MDSLPPGTDLCTIPAGIPPNGQLPNFTNPETLNTTTFTVCILLTAWAFLFTVARLYVHWRNLGSSDYFMAIAIILSITYTGLYLSESRFNRHQWDIPVCWYDVTYFKVMYAYVTLIGPALYFPKCAIFLMYRQFFGVYRWMRIATTVGLVVTFIIYLPSIIMSAIYQAPKPGQTWEQLMQSQLAPTSTSSRTMLYFGVTQGACSVLLDIFIFILPLPVLRQMHLAPKTKLQVSAVFGTAFFGVMASVIALGYRCEILFTTDVSWHLTVSAICNAVENNVTIIVGSMPAFSNFARLHSVNLSATFRSLGSKLSGGSARSSARSASDGDPRLSSEPKDFPEAPGPRQKPSRLYYEENHTTLLDTQLSTVGKDDPHVTEEANSGGGDTFVEAIRKLRAGHTTAG